MKKKYPYLNAEEKANFDTTALEIISVLRNYVFWPRNKDKIPGRDRADKIVFWSENHIFMMLGSCHLFQQFMNECGTWLGHSKNTKNTFSESSSSNVSVSGVSLEKGGISIVPRSSSDVPHVTTARDHTKRLEKYDSDISSVQILKPASVCSSSFFFPSSSSSSSSSYLYTWYTYVNYRSTSRHSHFCSTICDYAL